MINKDKYANLLIIFKIYNRLIISITLIYYVSQMVPLKAFDDNEISPSTLILRVML